ncbi:endonuclease VIII [Pseudomarimonas salicorniae]|uniref:DNA-(apurinic or apyrimidinic site) lyase n=1 Tax=Pseudomarimonas salicorniae TaxID=2933270 RepID=A0ABT0GE38_9GAMM|nr:endonuclease VIII [Lysobacter sp. CAU 1642]MCK7592424.1 endonuclease VIII [Lysobacter sp. CAU 1642]
MPEGPEIRRAADQLAKAVLNTPLQRVFFAFPELKRHERKLESCRIRAIEPRGKALLTRFDNGWTLYTHNQLYGVWKVGKPDQPPKTGRSLRVELATAKKAIRLYSASDVSLWRDAEIEQHPFLRRIGPDVLDSALDADTVAERLAAKRFSGRQLSALLLDQAFLAGMGNYLRSEVLFEAGLHPDRRPRELDEDEREALAAALLGVPRRSYRSRGIRRSQGMKAEYMEGGEDAFRFRVFDRAGEPCLHCGEMILRTERGSRRLYLCPRCQA